AAHECCPRHEIEGAARAPGQTTGAHQHDARYSRGAHRNPLSYQRPAHAPPEPAERARIAGLVRLDACLELLVRGPIDEPSEPAGSMDHDPVGGCGVSQAAEDVDDVVVGEVDDRKPDADRVCGE